MNLCAHVCIFNCAATHFTPWTSQLRRARSFLHDLIIDRSVTSCVSPPSDQLLLFPLGSQTFSVPRLKRSVAEGDAESFAEATHVSLQHLLWKCR